MHLDAREQNIITKFSTRTRALLGSRLKDMRVFGSRARGDARPSSDLDIFVLIDPYDRCTRNEILDIAEDIWEEENYAVEPSPLVMGVEEFEHLRARERRLALDILAEGIPV